MPILIVGGAICLSLLVVIAVSVAIYANVLIALGEELLDWAFSR